MSGIVVGVDGSEHSQRALEWAAREARTHRVSLTVLTVYQAAARTWGMALVPDPAEAADVTETTAGERAAREIAEKAVASLSEASPPEIIVRTVIGSPADELIDASAEADLLVVGNRGSGGFARLLLGSASTQVVHHAHCPVVVVPPADARPG